MTRSTITIAIAAAALFVFVAPSPAIAQATPSASSEDTSVRGTRLQGRVFAGRRQPIVGATVTVRRNGDESVAYFTTTGPDGVFRIEGLPDGTYSLLIRREGMQAVRKEGIALKFPFRAVVEVPMEPGDARTDQPDIPEAPKPVRLRGIVADPDGNPLPEVRIRMVRPDGGEDPLTARTDSAGAFDFGKVASGPWRTEISGVGFLTVRATMPITRDVDARIYLVTQPPGYDPSPLDLLPQEQPIPPDGWTDDRGASPQRADSRTAK